MPTNEKLERIHADTAASISARVSPSLHPDAISPHGNLLVDDQGGAGTTGYIAARRAKKAVYEALKDIDGAYASLLTPMQVGKETKTGKPIVEVRIPPERASELASLMARRAEVLGSAMQRSIDVVDESITALDQHVELKLTNPKANLASVATEAGQIRDYVKNLPQRERLRFLHDASERGDLTVVSAVIAASPWVSGLQPAELESVRQFARTDFAPRESKQADALRAIKKSIESDVSVFGREYFARLPKIPESKTELALAKLKGAA